MKSTKDAITTAAEIAERGSKFRNIRRPSPKKRGREKVAPQQGKSIGGPEENWVEEVSMVAPGGSR